MNMHNVHSFSSIARQPRPITTRGGGVILLDRSGEGLSLDEIGARCPSVFADAPHESRSDRYQHVDTREVLSGLIGQGFKVAEVRQGGSRIAGKAAFTKHALRLTAPDAYTVETGRGDKSAVQVLLRNSHDGTSSYQLRAGVYRFACLNGLVVGDDFEDFRITHKRGARDEIIDAAFRVVSQFPEVANGIQEMAGTDLDRHEQQAFAEAALLMRWTPPAADQEAKAPPIEPAQLMAPRRASDTGADLWSVMNRAQEGLIRGGQRYIRRGQDERGRPTMQRRSVGAVNGIEEDARINRALWTFAARVRDLKAAA